MATRIIQNISSHAAYPGDTYRLTYNLRGENIIGIFDWEPYRDATYNRFDPKSVEILKVSQISPPPFPWVQQVVVDVRFVAQRKLMQVFPETHFRPEGADMHLIQVLYVEDGRFPPVPGSIVEAVTSFVTETIQETATVAGEAVGAGIGGAISAGSKALSPMGKIFILAVVVIGGIWSANKLLN